MKDAKAEYLMKNLCCANCAAKMEAKIKELPGIKDASIAFTTKTLYINADNPESYLEQIRAICASIESQVEVLPKVQRGAKQEEDAHDQKRELAEIIVGAVLMLSGVVLSKFSLGIPAIICFVIAYIVLGYEVIGQALNNLKNGHLFDENFLMSIATIGAFIISDYAEAVGVMLFFRIGEYFEHRAVESSRKAIMEAIDMRPEKVHKIIDDMMVTIPAENAKVGDILQVRPGITDFSSVEFASLDEIVGETNADEVYEQHVLPRKNALRVQYAHRVSFWVDAKLLWKTAGTVLGKMLGLRSKRGT